MIPFSSQRHRCQVIRFLFFTCHQYSKTSAKIYKRISSEGENFEYGGIFFLKIFWNWGEKNSFHGQKNDRQRAYYYKIVYETKFVVMSFIKTIFPSISIANDKYRELPLNSVNL